MSYLNNFKRFHINKQQIIDKLFKRSNEAGNLVYRNYKGKNLLNRLKQAELQRIEVFFQIYDSFLFNILNSFPKYEELNSFYQKLLDALIGKKEFKITLGRLNKLRKILREEKTKANEKIKYSRKKEDIIKARKHFFGRMVSFLEDIDFDKLNNWVDTLYSFPLVEKNTTKVVILGLPNTGKSTLLSKITSSTPKIADYEFTTLIINRGLLKEGIEVFDTPGLLDREFDKLNKIEKEALIAFSELADIAIFIFDPFKNLNRQLNLLKRFLKFENNKKRIFLFYMSKEDLLKQKANEIKEQIKEKLRELNIDQEIYSLSNLKKLIEKIEEIHYSKNF